MNLVPFYCLVFVSGFSALLYEVVWQRYLAVLFGSQAWATVLVLCVFLGGLSCGYLLFGLFTRRFRANLIIVYAAVEIVLALWAFGFPTLFNWALGASFFRASGVGLWRDVLGAVLLLFVPTVLMGGTLPLLTQALSANARHASQAHAKIYGFNTLGSCFGCLAAGYWLVPWLGLAGATRVGGGLNAFVAVGAFAVSRAFGAAQVEAKTAQNSWVPDRADGILLGIGFASGAYLLALQTVLIRQMGLATGASNYNFTLIVAVFVLCLGVGSLAARRIADYRPSRLFWNQALAAVSLWVLYLCADQWSYLAHVVRVFFRDIPEGFGVYQSVLAFGMLLQLALPVGLTGLTLPLCYHLLRKKKEELGAGVGLLYGINTLGCIFGAWVGGYWALEFLNLDQVFKVVVVCVALTAAAAAALPGVWKAWSARGQVAAGLALGLGLAVVAATPLHHKERFVQPFRQVAPLSVTFSGAHAFGEYLTRMTKLVFWEDGPNTSVGVGAFRPKGHEVSRTLFVNGKSDGNTHGDLLTTVLLGHLPALFAEDASSVCVIGFGTGMTVGSVLHYPQVKKLDVVEISGTLIRNASYFDRYNGAVSASPKLRFHETDALRFLNGTGEQYGAIISEPSNPWVSGVENLFSAEFYTRVRGSLLPGGVFVQWIHTYSFSDALLQRVAATLAREFPFVSAFQLKGGDYALVATLEPLEEKAIARGQARYQAVRDARDELDMAGIADFETLLALQVMGPRAFREIASSQAPSLELLRPSLSDLAARAFFAGSAADMDRFRRKFRSYYSEMGTSLLRKHLAGRPLSRRQAGAMHEAFCRGKNIQSPFLCQEAIYMARYEAGISTLPEAEGGWGLASRGPASLKSFGYGSGSLKEPLLALAVAYDRFESFKKYASALFYVGEGELLTPVEYCLKSVPKDNELWGQCLLQKILVFEWLHAGDPEPLLHERQKFVDWFSALDPKSPNYGRLKEARNILERM